MCDNLSVTDVTISCNPDGTVHWVATVFNSGSCTAAASWKAQLQQHIPGAGGGFMAVPGATQPGASTFPPGTTTLSGDLCGVVSPSANRIRVEFKIDAIGCNIKKKSQTMDPCPATPSCSLAYDFPDVPVDSPFYTEIMTLRYENVVSGYADGTFRPSANVTRAQLAKIVALAFGAAHNLNSTTATRAQAVQQQHFVDVPTTHPFFEHIEVAYRLGWVSGYADGTFRPYANVTRGQVAKIVVAAAGLKTNSPHRPTFLDVAAGSTFYAHIETAYAAGLLSGYPDGMFRPDTNATRGQISKITLRAAFPPQE